MYLEQHKPKPYLIVLTGPTGVGKTRVAIDLAVLLGCPIISADSRQVYREMHIGTASPSQAELAEAEHHFIATRSIHDPTYNASLYASEALELLNELYLKHSILILCGGSMMYVDALTRGLDDVPIVPDRIRTNLWNEYNQNGIQSLREELRANDPEYLARIDPNNYKRIIRALELIRHTGKAFSSFHRREVAARPFSSLHLDLYRPRAELFARIDTRVELMIEQGLEAEAYSLWPLRHLNALDTVGYKEFFSYFDGLISREEAIGLIKRNTRTYARRQQTYWRHRPSVRTLNLSSTTDPAHTIIHQIRQRI